MDGKDAVRVGVVGADCRGVAISLSAAKSGGIAVVLDKVADGRGVAVAIFVGVIADGGGFTVMFAPLELVASPG